MSYYEDFSTDARFSGVTGVQTCALPISLHPPMTRHMDTIFKWIQTENNATSHIILDKGIELLNSFLI